jgi:hypothetical protein
VVLDGQKVVTIVAIGATDKYFYVIGSGQWVHYCILIGNREMVGL